LYIAAWNTKIVCTIGPASYDESVLEKMILAGMDVCRLNFSHGKYEEHQETFDKIRRLGEKYDNQVAILCDIQGPKIRTGKMKEPFEVAVGDKILVTPNDVVGTPDIIQISYETLVQDLDAGDFIFINDGTVKLEVEAKDTAKNELLCEVKTAGKISDNKGCNMPSGRLSVNVVTEKDARDLEYIAKNLNPEFVAASFIGTGEDVRKVRAELAKNGNDKVKIISKLERPVALENLEEIIKESDSIMVARGDLGVEIEAWDVPSWQKKAIFLSNKNSKPVIVATQVGIIIVCLPPTYCFSAAPPFSLSTPSIIVLLFLLDARIND
jgi:pyruvate kinase